MKKMEEILDQLPEEYKDDPGMSPELATYVMELRMLQMEAEFEGREVPYDDIDINEIIAGHPIDYAPRDDED